MSNRKTKLCVLLLITIITCIFSTTAMASGPENFDYIEGPSMPGQNGGIAPFNYYQSQGGQWEFIGANLQEWKFKKADGKFIDYDWLKTNDGQWYYFKLERMCDGPLEFKGPSARQYYLRRRKTMTNKTQGTPSGPRLSSWGSMLCGENVWYYTPDSVYNYTTYRDSGELKKGQNTSVVGVYR